MLSWFGGKEGEARRAYRRYVAEGAFQGKRPDLEGGGLVRSFGGWSAVLSLRRSREASVSDQRILGTGEFVEKVLEEAEERAKRGLGWADLRRKMRERAEAECRRESVSVEEMRNGSRRGSVSRVRAELAVSLVEELGVSLRGGRRVGGVHIGCVKDSTQAKTLIPARQQRPLSLSIT